MPAFISLALEFAKKNVPPFFIGAATAFAIVFFAGNVSASELPQAPVSVGETVFAMTICTTEGHEEMLQALQEYGWNSDQVASRWDQMEAQGECMAFGMPAVVMAISEPEIIDGNWVWSIRLDKDVWTVYAIPAGPMV